MVWEPRAEVPLPTLGDLEGFSVEMFQLRPGLMRGRIRGRWDSLLSCGK